MPTPATKSFAPNECALMQAVADYPGQTQSAISKRIGLSLGMTNILLMRLARKGYTKSKQLDRKRTEYLLTMKGALEKSRKSYAYTFHTIYLSQQIIAVVQNAMRCENAAGVRQATVVAWPETATAVQGAVADLDLPGLTVEYAETFTKLGSRPGTVFVVMNDTMPLMYCPLVIETIDGSIQGSYGGGGGTPLPLFHKNLGENQRRSLENLVFERCVEILKQHSAKRWFVYCDGVSDDHERKEDLLPSRFGALDISGQCHLMDLSLSKEDMWSEIRHSAKSVINQGHKTYHFRIYTHENFTFEGGERHRLLHHKCSGRVTRPFETLAQMCSWIEKGAGLMIE